MAPQLLLLLLQKSAGAADRKCKTTRIAALQKNVDVTTRFRAKLAAACQAGRGGDFSSRQSDARKLPHRRL
jgi:hypothetical protein